MRLMEGLRLRIKDVDFDRRVIVAREAQVGQNRQDGHPCAEDGGEPNGEPAGCFAGHPLTACVAGKRKPTSGNRDNRA